MVELHFLSILTFLRILHMPVCGGYHSNIAFAELLQDINVYTFSNGDMVCQPSNLRSSEQWDCRAPLPHCMVKPYQACRNQSTLWRDVMIRLANSEPRVQRNIHQGCAVHWLSPCFPDLHDE